MEQYDTDGMLKPEFGRTSAIPRPEGWMENPYIGPRGEDCHTIESLRAAQEDYARTFLVFIEPKSHNEPTPVGKNPNKPTIKKVDHTPIKVMDDLS